MIGSTDYGRKIRALFSRLLSKHVSELVG